jgi:hypothetical protein
LRVTQFLNGVTGINKALPPASLRTARRSRACVPAAWHVYVASPRPSSVQTRRVRRCGPEGGLTAETPPVAVPYAGCRQSGAPSCATRRPRGPLGHAASLAHHHLAGPSAKAPAACPQASQPPSPRITRRTSRRRNLCTQSRAAAALPVPRRRRARLPAQPLHRFHVAPLKHPEQHVAEHDRSVHRSRSRGGLQIHRAAKDPLRHLLRPLDRLKWDPR